MAKINMTYLQEEIPTAIQESLEGLKHVADIVRAMKEFAHPDEGEKVAIDLNKTIENIVKVARSEWKYTAEMVLELDPMLPEILAFPGAISQALLNIIVNAAHAITEVASQENAEKGTIVVTTCHGGSWAEVRIADTGAGIPYASS
jgi:signal transduction histidine kinase